MSATVPYSAKITGSTGTTSTASITAPTVGNTLLVMVTIPTASAPVTTFTDNLSNTYTLDHSGGGLFGSLTCYFYRKSNIANAPTSLSVTGTSGSFTATFEVVEVAGMDSASPLVSTVAKTDLSGGNAQVSHTASVTTTNSNDFVALFSNGSNARLLSSATNGYTVVTPETVNDRVHLAYLADAGSAGAKSTTLTFSGATSALILGVVYKSVPSGPTVSTVTGTTVTEGGSVVFTVTLSGATSATSNYAASFSGTATSADYNNALGSATYSDDVMFSGGDFVVPSGVSRFTVTIATTQDALDEDNETLVLRVGGVDSTGGTITDDDAAPTISVNDATENAGEVIFTVSLSAASGKTITVDYATADGTSTAGVDYTAKTGTLTFAAGETTKTVTVTVP